MDDCFASFGPFRRVELAAGGEGLRGVWVGPAAIALELTEARLAAEQAGHEALAGDPRAPAILDQDERTLLLEARLPDEPIDPSVLSPDADPRPITGTRRELLAELTGLRPGRTLRKLGLKASRVDRWLDATVELEVALGPTAGGIGPDWWARAGDRWVALRLGHARAHGWQLLDLAGLALDPATSLEALEPHADDPSALELAVVAVLLRERASHLADLLAPRLSHPEPERVRVWVEGPPFVRPEIWEPPGAEVSASRARWLLAHLDGLAIGGGRISVRVDPPIRKGRRGPVRERRAERRARLFSRWSEGIRVDDEGLYSATPEALAMRLAEGAEGVVLDATCGVGGLTIALARQPGVTRVIAVDTDADRLAMAAHNARIYDVEDRIELVHGDARDVLASHPADQLVVDPPWGGRGYDRRRMTFDDLEMDVRALLDAYDGPVLLKLPRSFDVATLGPGWEVEPIVDSRGIVKFIAARTRGRSSPSSS